MLKAVLVGADLVNDGMIDYYMKELENLAEASNIEVVYSMTQALNKITPNFYIGRGKVDEVKQFVINLEADMVIFNDELSGSQIRNIEEVVECRVIDRTLLILDIFASRAKTKEAMLQVEIAQLEYLRPRLAGMGASLNRQQGGIGSRGPGEKKLELDRRKIHEEIHKLKRELQNVVKSRQVQRKNRNRSNIKKIAIVGYTNAGKSTLLNTFVESTNSENPKEVFVKDMLFATLETATRHIQLPSNKEFVLTDTVGFVSNLPHNLVESFKSTLEEVTEADYLIHVVDASNHYHSKQIDVTNETLEEIGVHDIPTLYIYNKQDLIEEEVNPTYYPNLIVSLLDNREVSRILDTIEKEVFKGYSVVKLLIPFKEGELVSHLIENSHIINQEFSNEGTILELELSQILLSKYANYII
ncbi:GTPase HflX [Candidatus Izimaplasma bacterium HR1]|uniref:GTPase HflX n=1 Tax=Candidatus Izimoplasma sp. HR1 TaxID=1541959 RepID=UPI0004F7A38E|nr:GTPase HflX [Candidatus Izimaplasma bacterium HR1]